jgi:hypothetical protein
LALLRGPDQSSGPGERVEAIRPVIDFVMALATEPEEEGKPWWK